jgi:hypothetical protein
MAENDLELGAEWAQTQKGESPSAERLDRITEGWTEMRAAERAAKAELDAAAHRELAEARERERKAAERDGG